MSEDLILDITGSEYRMQWQALVMRVINLWVLCKLGNSFQNLNNYQLLKTDSDDGVSAQLWLLKLKLYFSAISAQ
jgi:hypothetical protein